MKRTRREGDAEYQWIYGYRDAVWASSLPSNAKLVALAMTLDCDWCNGRNARPGMKRLTELTGLSERTITRVRHALVDAGWMDLVELGSQKAGGRASTYDLTTPANRSGVELSTPDTVAGVTPDCVAAVETVTPANCAATPANLAPDPCQVGDLPLLTTLTTSPGEIDPTHKRVAAKALKSIRNGAA